MHNIMTLEQTRTQSLLLYICSDKSKRVKILTCSDKPERTVYEIWP